MGAQWKREKVQDHKFDFINVDDFVDNSCWRQFRYSLVFVAIMRGILVYCSDIFTAVNLLANKNPQTFVGNKGLAFGGGFTLPFTVYKYLFPACIIFGFLLLVLEVRRARGIVQSRDISYAFTSQMASRYYTVRSYPHYCFFSQINNSKKTVDEVAFFCFFTFRNWKRLMLADAPRQVINASILYQTFHEKVSWNNLSSFFQWDVILDSPSIFKQITLGAMIFTVVMFAFSLLMLVAAVLLYIPLVSHIQGNLKEYCCHKIDKRIEELIRKKTKSRAQAALKAGKKSNQKDIAMSNLQEPTLPQLDLLENNTKPLPTPRNAYTAQTPATYNTPYAGNKGGYGQQQQQQDYYDNNYGDYGDYGDYGYNNTNKNNGYTASPATAGYTQNYPNDDYFQTKPSPHRSATTTTSSGATTVVSKTPNGGVGYDPYSEPAYTDDIYDHYTGKEEHQHLQQKPAHDAYGDYYNTPVSNNGAGTYNQSSQAATPAPSSRTRRYDDYGHPQRSGSPLPSQHGSDLDSNHYGYDSKANSNSGTTRGGYTGNNTTNTSAGYGGYNNSHHNSADYYRSSSPAPGGRNNGSSQYQQQQQQYAPQTSPEQVPQRGRRQDTSQSNYRTGQGY